MLRRLAALPRWQRRLFALFAGLALGAGVAGLYLENQYREMRRLKSDYALAHETGDFEKLAALVCWDGVPAAERGRVKLSLKQELDDTLKEVRITRIRPEDGAPRDTLEGRSVPNLKPEFLLTAVFDNGVQTWLVGKTPDGYRIIVFRPENAPAK